MMVAWQKKVHCQGEKKKEENWGIVTPARESANRGRGGGIRGLEIGGAGIEKKRACAGGGGAGRGRSGG